MEKTQKEELTVDHFSFSLIQNSIDGIIAFDRDFKYNLWNPAMEKISGKGKDEVVGKLAFETFPFLMNNGEMERMQRTLKGEVFKVENLEYFVPETNAKGYYDAQYFSIQDPGGKIIGGMKVIHETTKRKLIEGELQYRNELLVEAQQIARMGHWVFDIASGVSYWSDEVYKLFSSEKIEGLTTFEILENHVFPEDYQNIQGLASRLITQGLPYQSQYRIKRTDGDIRMISTQGRPEFDETGKVVKIKGVCQDITDRWKAMEKINELNNVLELKVRERTLELSKKNEELLKINSDLDNFIYTASHDLKAPISNIEGLMISLSEELKIYSNQDMHTMISMIHSSIQRFKDTIKELTEITKIQKDIQEYENEDLKFSDIMDDVQFSLDSLMKECCPIIETDFAVASIKFSKKNLRSIIYNLISNGVKYRSTERECHLTITTEKKEDFVILSVKDNGLGIKQEHISKIFSMFKRLHDHVDGTGVGLYIVKRIIDNAGGKIEVNSREGEGTEFKVFLKSKN